MIVRLNNTTTSAIAQEIDELHVERGEAAQGRVLTLVIVTEQAHLETALETVNAASREHPCRVIAIVTNAEDHQAEQEADQRTAAAQSSEDCVSYKNTNHDGDRTLDAEIRFGSDAGAGEIIVLRPVLALLSHSDALVIPLLVPDAPLVVWWPANPPQDPSKDPIGAMATSRITDAMEADDPQTAFTSLLKHSGTADVDLSWTRTTIWRALLASMMDQPPHLPVTSVRVTGQTHFLPLELLASWLALKLGVPVTIERDPQAQAITGVFFKRSDGTMSMERHKADQARINQPGQASQTISMPLRTAVDCMSEEMGRLDPDEVYRDVISRGWPMVHER
ncbi:glucose-6-phosphate dehydrogenase assembly protein OpcA [Bifidobacterium sp. B4001]|uniref:glucose-6-phosphate dehydrogenase assembly protein OpcA n=1 Tax=unclassified Bifidobacterium TaxID=2608897 RepID=UPI00226B3FD6|nr:MULTISPECIES: glucose-6-phosphate dehydrogenase assembly protein OpcA [unclassified Bifidobacterium]MCX8647797.1 glucose-6-phosphate dehydrogenase assembly protein OpcA [Bifidobacterium sp. B4107]MCX8651977.1 glucose-6-phosphate dehydrogenase assembly protein OpcA [Bifidobacterium sp. B4111]MCX8658387.1 glucose-6-phosphate dehydrogenase assembly protein OpcA [Bifidobacterium sp. B4114]MCX8673325.1 glucose-6-phosphate dehydrogenase assembly protein OpcA [Bifidobacterium sp. B4079]MCX8681758.